jgi:hypothetical protein
MIPALLFPQQNPSQMLLKTHETAGVLFQLQSFSPESGSGKSYTLLAIPFQARYEHNRYITYTLRLNQGFQSFDGTGMYTLGDINLGISALSGENMTYLGEITLPIGSKNFEYAKLSTASAGRLPFVNAPVIYGASGLGLKIGASYGKQTSENTSIAFGARYHMRGEYKPVKGGAKYDPSNEFMLAAGIDHGDEEKVGFTGDLQILLYSEEKVGGKKYSDPGTGFCLSGDVYINHLNVNLLYFQRGESELSYSGTFKPPSIFRFKLSHQDVWNFIPLKFPVTVMPYVGYMKTGESTLVGGASLFLLGAYLEDYKLNGYPLKPFVEINFGSIGGDAGTFGFKIGTDVSFQMY